MLGRNFFSNTFVNGSNSEYDTKKIESVALYCPLVRPRCSCRPSIFALPILVRSRKEIRYRNESQGMSLRSSFQIRARS